MGWTYDSAEATSKDLVRGRIGDVDYKKQLLADETIQGSLDRFSDSVINASVECVKRILARIARDTDRNVGPIVTNRTQATNQYRELLQDLIKEQRSQATPTVKGVSIADQETLDADTDFRPHSFRVGQDDFTNAFPAPGDRLP